MDKLEKHIEYWLNSSNNDYQTMLVLFEAKKYSWSLFVGHLAIEKLLKAHYVYKKREHPPLTHNLHKLAIEIGLDTPDDIIYKLTTVTVFNINARYDDYKSSFQKKCTSEYTKEWIETIKELRQWIKKQIKL